MNITRTGVRIPHRVLLLTLVAGSFLVVLDASIVNVALVDIGADLHASKSLLPWVVDAYTVTFAGGLLTAGGLADRFGPRRVYVGALLGFAVLSVVCAAATTPAVLIAGRALQGATAAGLVPASLALLATLFPDAAARSRAIGLWAALGSVGFAAGPVVGGALVELGGWRLIFLINPVIVAAAVLPSRGLAEDHPASLRHFDLAGLITSTCGLAAVTFAVVAAGSTGWRHPTTLGAAAVGLAALLALPLIERGAQYPALPPRLLTTPRVATDLISAATTAFAFYGSLYALTIWMLRTRHLSPLHTGLAFLPMTLPMCVLPFVTGRLIARYGTRPVIRAGLAVSLTGAIALTTADHFPAAAVIALGTLLAVAGTLTIPATTADISIAAPAPLAATAQGALGAARQTGVVLGIAAMSATNTLRALGILAAAAAASGLVAAALLTSPRALSRTVRTP